MIKFNLNHEYLLFFNKKQTGFHVLDVSLSINGKVYFISTYDYFNYYCFLLKHEIFFTYHLFKKNNCIFIY